MAKANKTSNNESISLTPEDPNKPRPKLHKLIVKNFRSIGSTSVEVELDDIVVLVGPNNSGKSSILRAYEVVMKQGSNEGKLQIDDFPNGVVDASGLPEIELQTVVSDNAPGERWLQPVENGGWLIRERWVWTSPGINPERRGFDTTKNEWDDQVPWGAPNVANSRRPLPHRIEAFSQPEVQAKEIVDLLLDVLKEKLKSIKSDGPEQEKPDYEVLLEAIRDFQIKVVESAKLETEKIEDEISSFLEKVFPTHRIKLDAKPDTDIEKSFTPFKTSPDLLMGPTGGYLSKISQQGSGARRTLLWAALRYLSESANAKDSNARPHVLLLDEPEMCLHPNAVREAREVLYNLPSTKNWQVMITTHSPIFIDLAKDNTTVVRVERQSNNSIHSVTLYRPTRAKLDNNDRANLKAINSCDPYVNEFFFGGNVIVVEGDTEYTAFSLIKNEFYEKYRNLHIVRARGKGSILTLLKILNQFSASFSILHDSDVQNTKIGKNPAWGTNNSISLAIESSPNPEKIGRIISITDFEVALFGESAASDKPYNTLIRLRENPDLQTRLCLLLDALLDSSLPTPDGFYRWTNIDDLDKLVTASVEKQNH